MYLNGGEVEYERRSQTMGIPGIQILKN
jgi:hypothetical protein